MSLESTGMYRFYVPVSMRDGLKPFLRRKVERDAVSAMLRESLRAYIAQRAREVKLAKSKREAT